MHSCSSGSEDPKLADCEGFCGVNPAPVRTLVRWGNERERDLVNRPSTCMLALARKPNLLMFEPMLKPTVLVLDDDEDNVAVLEAALVTRGFDVRTAGSAAEARALLSEQTVDALVTDFSLGDGDALELMIALGERRPKINILVTGYGSPEDQARSRAAGFDSHLVKPIVLEQLEDALRRGLERNQGAREPSDRA
ncbi:hypothetical protein BH11MYX4_BH11MYX4_27750 [soil metagenome]